MPDQNLLVIYTANIAINSLHQNLAQITSGYYLKHFWVTSIGMNNTFKKITNMYEIAHIEYIMTVKLQYYIKQLDSQNTL